MKIERAKSWIKRMQTLAVVLVTVGVVGRAQAEEISVIKQSTPPPVHGFAQVGIGLMEVAHAEVGAFVGPHVTLEAMATWAGVFGAHYGGGVMYSVGTPQGPRPPRHALLVGARLMVDPTLSIKSGGDGLNSYLMLPVGYGFLADNGFYLRATAGLVVLKESNVEVGGPMFNLGVGYAF